MAGGREVSYNPENAEDVINKLVDIAGETGSMEAKPMTESKGETTEKVNELEEKIVQINQSISELCKNTAALLECLASTWEEFDQNIHQRWQNR